LVVGKSGSGKTSFLEQIARSHPECFTLCDAKRVHWDDDRAVISELGRGMTTEQAMRLMSSIGLNSVRTWLKPFRILSQGERYRATFARLLAAGSTANGQRRRRALLMDDFGSVLDGTTARCMAASISKCIKKQHSKFVLASSSVEVVRYLQPDLVVQIDAASGATKWVLNPNDEDGQRVSVLTVVDLPPFARKKDDRGPTERIHGAEVGGDAVLEFKCSVLMDEHSANTSRILDVEEFEGETVSHIPSLEEVPRSFAIGVFFGPSGCGKTTCAERLFGRARAVEWDPKRSVISHFRSTETAKALFAAMALPRHLGLGSFCSFSVGEQHRVNMARILDDAERASSADTVVIDEFTSSLDRETAHKVAVGISDYVERHNLRRIVLLCCKRDIVSSRALRASWLFDVEQQRMRHVPDTANDAAVERPLSFGIGPAAFHRPRIRIVFKPTDHRDFSPTFSKFHYLNATISNSAVCFSVWAHFGHFGDGKEDLFYNPDRLELVGFTSILHHYGRDAVHTEDGAKKIDFREHRTVVLPPFQGLGFGSRIADGIGEYLGRHGLRLHSKTAHPRYGGYRDRRASSWIATPKNGQREARKQWKTAFDRCLFGTKCVGIGQEKVFFNHIFALRGDAERTQEVEDMLAQRVVVTKSYAKI